MLASGSIVTLLIDLLIVGIIVWAVSWFLDTLTLPSNVKLIAKVIVGVIALIWLLRTLGFAI